MIEKNAVILDLNEYQRLEEYKRRYDDLKQRITIIDKDNKKKTNEIYHMYTPFGSFSNIDHYELDIKDLKLYLGLSNDKLIIKDNDE